MKAVYYQMILLSGKAELFASLNPDNENYQQIVKLLHDKMLIKAISDNDVEEVRKLADFGAIDDGSILDTAETLAILEPENENLQQIIEILRTIQE